MKVRVYKCRPLNHPLPLFAWGIMFFQGFKPWHQNAYSHFAIEYESVSKYKKVIDSTSKGVRDSLQVKFFEKYKIIDRRDIEINSDIVEFLRWYEIIENRPYDFLQIFGLFLKMLGFFTFNKMGKNYKALICNEVILSMLEELNGMKFGDPDNYDLNMTWQIVTELA